MESTRDREESHDQKEGWLRFSEEGQVGIWQQEAMKTRPREEISSAMSAPQSDPEVNLGSKVRAVDG